MKKQYFSGLLLLTTLAAHANSSPVVDNELLLKAKKQVEKIEYFIKKQDNTTTYRSPNPMNGLKATYTGNELNIVPEKADQQWAFKLTVKEVGGYNPVVQPLVSMHENTVQFDHDHHFKVEYINDENGIQQKFIIQEAGTATGKVTVQLQPENGWNARYKSATSLAFENNGHELDYSDLKVTDAKGNKLPAHFTVRQNQVEISVDAEHAVYPLSLQSIVGELTLLYARTIMQSDQAGAQMGAAVSAAGDVNADGYPDVVVGAPYYSKGESHEGAVFIFYGSEPNGINPNNYTVLEKNVPEGHFGEYVTGGGDVNGDGFDDVLVGVPYHAGTFNNDTGMVYVYYGSAAGTSTTPEIIRSLRQDDHFGISVAIAPDIDGDGNDDVLIGADKGEGYVTVVYGSSWGLEYAYTSELAVSGTTGFGSKVSDAGSISGAGSRAVMVVSNEGLYIFNGDFSGVQMTPSQTIPRPDQAGSFGSAIAGGGDVNGDGYDDIIVGAKDYADIEHNRLQAGAFFLYIGSSTGIVTTPHRVVVFEQDSTLYGSQIAFVGDINQDGFDDAVVGAPKWKDSWDDTPEEQEGAAFLYYGYPPGINFWAAGFIHSNKTNALLGSSVAGVGDVNGDGYPDLLVGAPGCNNPQVGEGIAAIFLGAPYTPARMAGPHNAASTKRSADRKKRP